MKKRTFFFKIIAAVAYTLRFALAIGFVVFTISTGKSQVNKTYVTNNPSKEIPANKVQSVSKAPVQSPKTEVVYEKMGAHAPDINDPDYRTKVEEWAKNYPEEFSDWVLRSEESPKGVNSNKYPELNQGATNNPRKVAEHAPFMNDPDYQVKKEEWIKNYPQEYEQSLNSSIPQNK